MWSLRNISSLLVILLIGCNTLVYAQNVATDNGIKTTTPSIITSSATPETTKRTTTSTTTTTTTTTTPAPTTPATTTTIKPSPKPTPTPAPSTGKWNSSCVMVQMAAQLNFTYETIDNKNATVLYNLPSDADLQYYTCSDKTQQLVLEWGPVIGRNSLTLQFDKNETKNIFSLFLMHFKIQAEGEQFPNAKENQTIELLHLGNTFDTPLQMSYHCTREQDLNMTESIADENLVGTVALTNVQFEAFRPANSTKFSTAKDCDAMDTPDVVPIAVGIALAALILIVLIAYLIARRRSTARGYTSF